MASRFGWADTRGMDWREFALSLQLVAEERIGFVARYGQRLARAREDAAWAAMQSALGDE